MYAIVHVYTLYILRDLSKKKSLLLDEKVKFHLKRDWSQEQCLEAISEWVVQRGHADCCLVTEPGVAGEGHV